MTESLAKARAAKEAKQWVADRMEEGLMIHDMVKLIMFQPLYVEDPYKNLVNTEIRKILSRLVSHLEK